MRHNLGLLYQHGLGVKQDYSQAMAWYYRAASHGSTAAQNNIGILYMNEFAWRKTMSRRYGGSRERRIKVIPTAKTASAGFTRRAGLSSRTAEAAKWYRKAADQENTRGQGNLGWLYLTGNGVQQVLAAIAVNAVIAWLSIRFTSSPGPSVGTAYV